jgi:cytochrome c553
MNTSCHLWATMLAVGLVAVATSAQAADKLVGNADAGQAEVGSVCAACHGADGNSTDSQYPKLAGQHANYIEHQLELFQSGKRANSIMSGMAGMLSKQDIANVAAYLSQQKMSPGPVDTYQPALGQSIYRDGIPAAGLPSCESCHGPAGLGDSAKLYPRIAGQHAQYVVQVLTGWHNGQAWGDGPHAKLALSVGQKLTIEQIQAIASYVQGLNALK